MLEIAHRLEIRAFSWYISEYKPQPYEPILWD